MFYFAIVDDQQLDIDKIKNMIIKYCNNYSITYSIDSYLKDSKQLYEKKYDAIFLDIDLPKINGLNIAKKINSIYITIVVIYLDVNYINKINWSILYYNIFFLN